MRSDHLKTLRAEFKVDESKSCSSPKMAGIAVDLVLWELPLAVFQVQCVVQPVAVCHHVRVSLVTAMPERLE